MDLESIEGIATGAGALIEAEFANSAQKVLKAYGSPQTPADVAADAFIRKELSRLYPTIPVISEESELPSLSERRGWKTFWLVDPLDGTKEYLAGLAEFTV